MTSALSPCKEDPRIVIRAWTGADTAGLAYTQRTQAAALAKVIKNWRKNLGVADRLDIRPLDFQSVQLPSPIWTVAHVLARQQ